VGHGTPGALGKPSVYRGGGAGLDGTGHERDRAMSEGGGYAVRACGTWRVKPGDTQSDRMHIAHSLTPRESEWVWKRILDSTGRLDQLGTTYARLGEP